MVKMLNAATCCCMYLPNCFYDTASSSIWCFAVTMAMGNHLYCYYGLFTLCVVVIYYSRHGSVELTADEKTLVLQQLPTGVSHTEVDAVLGVLGQILTGSTAANEEDIGEQDQVCSIFAHISHTNLVLFLKKKDTDVQLP